MSKHKNFLESQIKPGETGIKKEKSKQLELFLVIEDTTLIQSSLSQNEQQLFTQESVVTNHLADLHGQANYLRSLYPKVELITEMSSGLNYKRKKFKAILERVMSGNVEFLVVGHKARLARFGFELFNWLCKINNCRLMVVNNTDLSPEREMVKDIQAIVHVFSCRFYGLHKYKSQIKEDKDLSPT